MNKLSLDRASKLTMNNPADVWLLGPSGAVCGMGYGDVKSGMR